MKSKMIVKAFTLLTVMVTVAACSNSDDGSSGGWGAAFILTTDYTTGAYSSVDTNSREASNNIGSTHGDADVTTYEGLVYVINRFGQDNIQVIDPDQGYATIRQFTTGAGANPQDIAFVSSTKAYVSRYESSELWIVNPSTGEQTGSIDLSAYADSDGVPEMAALHISGDNLYVAIQALDRNSYYSPTGQSVVVVIDTGSDSVITSMELPFQNPVSDFVKRSDGTLIIVCSGYWGVTDGGFAVIAGANVSALSTTEVDFDGELSIGNRKSFTIYGDIGFAVVSDASFNTNLYMFDLAGGAPEAIYQPSGFSLAGIAVNGSELWVSDRTFTNPGVRVFSAISGDEITTDPIDVGLPPVAIAFP